MLEWLTLIFSAVAAIAAIASTLIAWSAKGKAVFVIETSWYDGYGSLGKTPWSGSRKGIIDVTLRNISANPASEVILETDDCSVDNPFIGVITASDIAEFKLKDVGTNPVLIVRYRLSGRGRKRRHDVELSKQPRTL